MSAVLALSCPRCSGALDPQAGTGLLARCENCGVLARIEDETGLSRLAVRPAIDDRFAWQVADEEAQRANGGRQTRLLTSNVIFVPYWRVDSLIVGRLTGRRPRTRNVVERNFLPDGSSAVRTREVTDGFDDIDREIQKHFICAIAACPLEDLGLVTLDRHRQDPQGLGIKRRLDRIGNLVHFSSRLRDCGLVLDPLIRKEQALAHARDLLSSYTTGLTHGLEQAHLDTAVVDRHLQMIYYPVISMTFQSDQRRGRAVVDAVTGRLLSITLPKSAVGVDDRRFVVLAALGSSWLTGSIAHLAAFPPEVFSGQEDARFFLLAAAVGLALTSAAGIGALISQIQKKAH